MSRSPARPSARQTLHLPQPARGQMKLRGSSGRKRRAATAATHAHHAVPVGAPTRTDVLVNAHLAAAQLDIRAFRA